MAAYYASNETGTISIRYLTHTSTTGDGRLRVHGGVVEDTEAERETQREGQRGDEPDRGRPSPSDRGVNAPRIQTRCRRRLTAALVVCTRCRPVNGRNPRSQRRPGEPTDYEFIILLRDSRNERRRYRARGRDAGRMVAGVSLFERGHDLDPEGLVFVIRRTFRKNINHTFAAACARCIVESGVSVCRRVIAGRTIAVIRRRARCDWLRLIKSVGEVGLWTCKYLDV
jgi:hypothetical protein